ncbi:MAG: hypothetical protein B9S32_16770 [Verrucomicrobia bacterium Tous-C9LFEB]|nr:MAG: hypothetical protein B9S32_16770 [Verrucomicrobia bacterium Tous-C9LFEB]
MKLVDRLLALLILLLLLWGATIFTFARYESYGKLSTFKQIYGRELNAVKSIILCTPDYVDGKLTVRSRLPESEVQAILKNLPSSRVGDLREYLIAVPTFFVFESVQGEPLFYAYTITETRQVFFSRTIHANTTGGFDWGCDDQVGSRNAVLSEQLQKYK